MNGIFQAFDDEKSTLPNLKISNGYETSIGTLVQILKFTGERSEKQHKFIEMIQSSNSLVN